MTIKGCLLKLEIDTRATTSINSQATYQKPFSEVTLNALPLQLKSYNGEHIAVISEMITQVQYDSHTNELNLIVVQEKGPSLFGHNWLEHSNLIGKLLL